VLSYFNFLAGIALMLFGIRTLRHGTERLLGSKLRQLLQTATKSRTRAFLVGLLIAILTPSSTAVALLSVEAINAGYVTFQHVLALMLGANIGFTVTVQLLAFRFYIFNTVFIAIGVPLFLVSKGRTGRGAGETILGIGFLLLSVQILTASVAPLKDSPDVRELMRLLENHPEWMLVFGLVLKVGMQSATAVIGIAMALCAQQVLPLGAAIAVVLGANIGIAVTALIAGYAQTETRRMAVGNLFFKLAGAAVCLPLTPWVISALRPLSPSGDAQLVANAHSLFNVALAIAFLPLVQPVTRVLARLVPERVRANAPFGPRYLNPPSLDSPAFALGQVTREILHMADIVREMLRNAYRCFSDGSETLCEDVRKEDDKVDLLNSEIKAYITRLSEQALNAEESRREVALLAFANDLESIGDIIDRNLIDLAEKKISLKTDFSKEGWVELEGYFHRVLENFEIAISAFASQDKILAAQLLRHKHHINEAERELRNRHFHRLHAGLTESFETSAVHLDVLTNLRWINSHLTAVAYAIVETGPNRDDDRPHLEQRLD
jgi:phosphate:Na+ symporter